MRSLIEDAEIRLEMARMVESDLMGHDQGGLKLDRIDEYIAVDDGQDTWLAKADEYDEAVESVVGEVLNGSYDRYCLPEDHDELKYLAYERLCSLVSAIYTRIGTPSDIQAVKRLEVDEDTLGEILSALGEE